jgi:chemosensory pili system protein ChpA (sensor histidine kinase/response regulator)
MDSQRGRGTTFMVRLPLTLAVTQVVVLSTGGNTYAVPSVLVEQVQQLKAGPLADAYAQGAVPWRGEQVPLYFLSELLGDSSVAPVTQQYSPLLILKSGDMRVAVHVDEVVGNREVVVKNIGPQLARMPGVAGATVLGSGDIVLILDPVPLAQRLVEAERAAPRDEQAPQAPRSQPIVMVVDDSLTVRRVTQRFLTREGYQVMLAKDGVDALEQLQTVTPHLMLVDIEMPRMDGFDLTRNVRDDIRTRHIPIIMITSRTATKHRNYAMELGVNEYLGKPYREADLLGFVAAYTRNDAAVASGS